MKEEKWESLVVRKTRFVDFDDEELVDDLMKIYREGRLQGKILSDYSNNLWELQERDPQSGRKLGRVKRIRFDEIDEKMFSRYLGDQMTYEEFVDCLKKYALLLYGENTFGTIAQKFPQLIEDIENSRFFHRKTAIYDASRRAVLTDFYSYLNVDTGTFIEESKELQILGGKKITRPRCLCKLVSYFTLNEELECFWMEKGTLKEKIFFYPLYLFWIITSIVPMRSIDFVHTPYDCLKERKDGTYFVRTYSIIKGSKRKKEVNHGPGDFRTEEIPIPEWIAVEIRKYKEYRNKYPNDGSLFSTQLLKDYHPTGKVVYTDVFTQRNLRQLLNLFYTHYLFKTGDYSRISEEEKGRYRIRYTKKSDSKIKLEVVKIGDIRHIAIINMIRHGCSVQALKKICHHESIDISLHYGNNIDQFETAHMFVLFSRYRREFARTVSSKKGSKVRPAAKNMHYKSKGMLSLVAIAESREISDSDYIDMGDCYCTSHRKIESRKRNIAEGHPDAREDNADCYKAFIIRRSNPCDACMYGKPKKESYREVDKELKKEFSVNFELVAKGIPTIYGGSFADLDNDIEEALNNLKERTEMQERLEAKKHLWAI